MQCNNVSSQPWRQGCDNVRVRQHSQASAVLFLASCGEHMIAQAKAQISRLLPKTHFARSVGVLVGGTASAQLLVVLTAPLLTRLYTPDDFGLLAVYASLLALVGVIASLRYELAIPLPESDQEAAHLVVLSLLIVVAMTGLAGLIILFYGDAIAELLGVPPLVHYFWLLLVGLLLGGAYKIFHYWAIRTRQFQAIAGTRIRQTLATLIIQVLGFKVGAVTLLVGQAAGQGVGMSTLGRKVVAQSEFRHISAQGLKYGLCKHKNFPFFSTWAGFINTAGRELPPMIMAAVFSPAAAGLYALSNRVINAPLALIGSAVGDVHFSSAAAAHREGGLGVAIERLHSKLSQVAMPPAIIVILVGPELFSTFFGGEWRQSGVFAQWLSLSLYAAFVTSPLSMTFSVVEKQYLGTIMQIQLFAMRITPMLIVAYFGGVTAAVAAYAVGSFVGYLTFTASVFRIVNADMKIIVLSFMRSLGVSLVCVSPLFFTWVLFEGNTYLVGLGITLVFLAIYYVRVARPS